MVYNWELWCVGLMVITLLYCYFKHIRGEKKTKWEKQLKATYIQFSKLFLFFLLVNVVFQFIPDVTEERCMGRDYSYWDAEQELETWQKFIPLYRWIFKDEKCPKYAYEINETICDDDGCYLDKKVVYYSEEFKERFGGR